MTIQSRATTADPIRIDADLSGSVDSGGQVPQTGAAAQHDGAAGRGEGRQVIRQRHKTELNQLVEDIAVQSAYRCAGAQRAQYLPLIGAELKIGLGQHGLLLRNKCVNEQA